MVLHVRAVLAKQQPWNYHSYRFDDNLSIQLYSFNSLYLISPVHSEHTNPVIAYFANIVEREQDGQSQIVTIGQEFIAK